MTVVGYADVDAYLEGLFGPPEALLARVEDRCEAAWLPRIAIAPGVGRLLAVLVRACAARRVLEIGTLGGYSAIWLARGLPADGSLLTLELDPRHAEVARANLADAGLADRVEVRVGRAAHLLEELIDVGTEPFDLVFIDADKASYPVYLDAALALSRPGTLLVADNVVRGGEVALPTEDEDNAGIQAFNARLAADPAIDTAFLQIVGRKRHDGIAVAVVTARPGPARRAGRGGRPRR